MEVFFILHTVKYTLPQLLFIFNCHSYVSRPKKWGQFSSCRCVMLCGYCLLPLTCGRQSVQVDFCMPVLLVFIVPVITSIIEGGTLFIWMLCFVWQEKCRSSLPPFLFFSRVHLMIHSVFNVTFSYCLYMYNFNCCGCSTYHWKCLRF
jgi:hypothetical protein